MERSRYWREIRRASLEFVANAIWLEAHAIRECITKSYDDATLNKLDHRLAFEDPQKFEIQSYVGSSFR
jgi:hypothetical protein